MEEELPQGAEGAEGTEPPIPPYGIPPLPPELSAREQELRALIDAGAASPEELRELAAKLKAKRSYEESLWQRDVRPALIQSKKKRPSIVDLRRDSAIVDDDSNNLVLGAMLLVAVLVLFLIATQTSFLILLVAAGGVLVYAWVHGTRPDDAPAPDPTPPDPTD